MFSFYTQRIFIVRRPKLLGPGFHYGISLPEGTFVDYGRETGLRISDASTFSAMRDVEIVREVPIGEHAALRQRLRKAMLHPTQYDLMHWNCETFANWLAGEEPRSDQIRWAGTVTFAIGLMALLGKP